MQGFFFRVAALAFESCILKDLEKGAPARIGLGDSISELFLHDIITVN